jgi:hypothetical protein
MFPSCCFFHLRHGPVLNLLFLCMIVGAAGWPKPVPESITPQVKDRVGRRTPDAGGKSRELTISADADDFQQIKIE